MAAWFLTVCHFFLFNPESVCVGSHPAHSHFRQCMCCVCSPPPPPPTLKVQPHTYRCVLKAAPQPPLRVGWGCNYICTSTVYAHTPCRMRGWVGVQKNNPQQTHLRIWINTSQNQQYNGLYGAVANPVVSLIGRIRGSDLSRNINGKVLQQTFGKRSFLDSVKFINSLNFQSGE